MADTHKLQMMALDPTRFGMQPHKFNGLVTPPIKIRPFSFLHDERTHADIRNGVVDVAVGGGGGGGGGGGAMTLSRHATNVQAKAQLASVAHARVLRLSDAEGAFRGWESEPTQALVFNTIERFFLLGGDWCCSSRVANEGRLYPVDPPPLVAPR